MAYIGNQPFTQGIGLFSQDSFTGDGSTTTFDLTNAAPDGGSNDIQVFVDNVRQKEGSSNAYTLGFDGSSVLKRITFTAAPAAAAAIYVLNPGEKNVQQITTISNNTITTAKLQTDSVTAAKITDLNVTTGKIADLNVTTGKIAADAINATKIADNSISEEHLDATAITGHTELATTAADDDVLLIYDTSATAIKKIQKSNIASAETFTSLVQDTTPQLGGNLDPNSQKIAGSLIPSTNDSFDLGATSFVWANIYTGDLNLSNEAKEQGNDVDGTKGSWTIQEGSDDLFLINNNSGKKYKFKLEEI